MSDDRDIESPAERRVVELLGALRSDPPVGDPGLPALVAQSARWQRAVRGALQVTGVMAAAALDAAAMLIGSASKRVER